MNNAFPILVLCFFALFCMHVDFSMQAMNIYQAILLRPAYEDSVQLEQLDEEVRIPVPVSVQVDQDHGLDVGSQPVNLDGLAMFKTNLMIIGGSLLCMAVMVLLGFVIYYVIQLVIKG